MFSALDLAATFLHFVERQPFSTHTGEEFLERFLFALLEVHEQELIEERVSFPVATAPSYGFAALPRPLPRDNAAFQHLNDLVRNHLVHIELCHSNNLLSSVRDSFALADAFIHGINSRNVRIQNVPCTDAMPPYKSSKVRTIKVRTLCIQQVARTGVSS